MRGLHRALGDRWTAFCSYEQRMRSPRCGSRKSAGGEGGKKESKKTGSLDRLGEGKCVKLIWAVEHWASKCS